MKNWSRIVSACLNFSASVLLLVSAPVSVFAVDLAANSFSVARGTYNGNVTDLEAMNDGRVLNLYSNRNGKLVVDFVFSAEQLSGDLSLVARFKQFTGSNKFQFKYQSSSGSFVGIGATTGSANTYKLLSYDLANSAIVNGKIKIRLVAARNSDDCDLDYLAIRTDSVTAVISEPAPTPVLEPAPAPVIAEEPVVTSTPVPTAGGSASISVGDSWYWQLQGSLDMNVNAKVYDIDLYDTSAATIAALKSSGLTVICYFSAGTYENWRADASQFPSSALGNKVSGWAGEQWLDVRNATVRQIMENRMDLAKEKGCDGLEPDNVDGYSNSSGFPLSANDQINFNSFLADAAHARGMIVALKNSTDLVTALVDKFDFAVVEECFRYNECSAYSPFINKNKAVLNAEYSNYSSAICTKAQSLKFSTVFYSYDLDGKVYNPCP